MRNRISLIIMVIVCVFLIGCDNQSKNIAPETGSLIASIAKQRTILPTQQSLEVKSYKVVGFLGTKKLIDKDFFSDSITLENLKVGTWTFTIYGLNETGIITSSRDETIKISAAQTTSKAFILDYLKVNGSGIFSYTVKVNELNSEIERIVLLIKNVDKSKTDKTEISIVNDADIVDGFRSYSSNIELEVGNYLLTVYAYKSDSSSEIISQESVYIINNLESVYEKTIQYNGKVATPVISQKDGIIEKGTSISITCATEGSEIYYTTDGRDPQFGTLYTGPFKIEKNTKVRAIAIADKMYNSTEVLVDYHVVLDANFSIKPDEGIYKDGQELSITSLNGGSIFYSLNDENYILYDENKKIKLNQNSTVKIYESLDGFDNSPIVTKNYSIQTLTPQFSIASGDYTDIQDVTISSSENSKIYYTLDGSTPTENNSLLYDTSITISETTTLRAIATKDNLIQSEEAYINVNINGNTNFSVSSEQLGSLSIKHPSNWGTSTPDLVPGVSAILEAEFSLSETNVVYHWFLDGNEVASGKKLALGTTSQNLCLGVGNHTITCLAIYNEKLYSTQYELHVSGKTGIGTSGPSYLIGSIGPAGGYVFYDCDADNTEEDPDGPDNLRSDVCGWRYMETTKSLSNCFVGCFYNEDDELVMIGTKSEIGSGKENTKLLVEAMKKYNVKKFYDGNSYITDPKEFNSLAPVYIDNYVYNGYDDWFMPSFDELHAIYEAWFNDRENFGGGITNFIGSVNNDSWSSTEYNTTAMMIQAFFTNQMIQGNRHSSFYNRRVFAVRSFL